MIKNTHYRCTSTLHVIITKCKTFNVYVKGITTPKRLPCYYNVSLLQYVHFVLLLLGLIVGDTCYHWFRIIFVLLLILAIILVILVFVLLCHTRKKLMSQHDKLRAKQTEKWSKIQQVLNSQTVSKQKPPAATLPPKAANW